MLLATALRVRAAGNSDLDTSALMVGIIGVLIIVVPAPSAKVKINNKAGVVTSKRVSIPSIIDTVNMYPHVMSKILRRSKRSDNDQNMNVLWKQYNMAKTVERGFVDLIKIYEKLKK